MDNSSKKTVIQKRIQFLSKKIKEWNYAYYVLNKPLIPDIVYDKYFQELKKLQKSWPDLKIKNSPTDQVGNQVVPQRAKISHQVPMLSLDNVFNKEGFHNFVNRVNKITNNKHTYYCEPKIDGLPVSLVFRNHFFQYGVTRGDGQKGENVTNNIKTLLNFKNLLTQKQLLADFELRGEIFMTNTDFKQLNQTIYIKNFHFLKNKLNSFKNSLQKELQTNFPTWTFLKKESLSYQTNSSTQITLTDDFELLSSQKKLFSKQIKVDLQFVCSGLEKKLAYSALKTHFSKKVNLLKKKIFFFSESQPVSSPVLVLTFSSFFTFPENQFVNPRNAASGSLRQLDPTITAQRKLKIHFYSLLLINQNEIPSQYASQLQRLQTIQKLNFPINQEGKFCSDSKAVLAYLERIKNLRKTLTYSIDGVVIKINEHKYYKLLKTTSHHVNYWIAYKFPAEVKETQLITIFSTLGRTGKITYNAKLAAIFLSGSQIQAATLHNAQYIKNLDIREGDFVYIKKAGDIIPKVIGVNQEKRRKNLPIWKEVWICFSCQQPLTILPNEVDQYCLNPSCKEKKIRALIHFVSLNGMNIVGLNNKTIRQFYSLELITKIEDIYRLETTLKTIFIQKITNQNFWKIVQKYSSNFDITPLKKTKGWGLKSFYNLYLAIKKSRENNYLDKILFALSIRHLGVQSGKILVKKFLNINKLALATKEELVAIPEIGPSLATSLISFFAQPTNKTLLDNLAKYQLKLFYPDNSSDLKKSWINTKKVVITGTFSQPRSLLIKQLEEYGALILTVVTNKTDLIFAGQNPGQKLQDGLAKKIPIYSETQLFSLLKFEKNL